MSIRAKKAKFVDEVHTHVRRLVARVETQLETSQLHLPPPHSGGNRPPAVALIQEWGIEKNDVFLCDRIEPGIVV